ncbi:coiled-coil domain-containing protein AGAP005037 isoform X4 [Trichoplusia ni]|uniref:Coiled-coil domain-containing protein AGAP005037 isoform X4 n=1 Tax=Trichoplusia ni TaxID=7111 RepID=A0A7E5WNS8_TRINI|nr:coiled-coil domain-containing protein AGAP005037 isoform X4 [Trichoplusia ni]
MSENNKKRAGSFRKLFPNLFFSHKSKDKNANKETQSNTKSSTESSKGNQYHNPRSIRSDKGAPESGDSERIYENLTTRRPQNDNETLSNEISSHHSSSSTLVSESTKNKSIDTNEASEAESIAYTNYAARPQVPPKPYNEMSHSPHTSSRNNQLNDFDKTQYPDVYYHSLEKLNDKISPLDEIEIYRASQAQANPASVGAEIKRVSTKFLISPKKEAEVRTIQPTRARSLSFDNNKAREDEENKKVRYYNKREENIRKPYNYSAPTSPMPISHKIPNMPKTVSPYEHVRKTMIETEEKRNSLSRSSLRNKSTPSPRADYSQRLTPTPQDNSKQDSKDKEKTRQKVEAFYWQKLKELKQKEDEYLIKQSLNSSLSSPVRLKPAYNSNCSSPNSFSYRMDSRSGSLPRGQDLKSSMNQPIYASGPFARGAPERRTDTFIKRRIIVDDPEIIYRHPEKLISRTASPDLHDLKLRNYYRGTIPQQNSGIGMSKRVSFEEKYGKTSNSVLLSARELKVNENKMQNRQTELNVNPHKVSELQSRVPPRPPVRTTSVGGTGKNIKLGNNKKIIHFPGAVHSLCSESESGSEAGEIQRILKTNAQKEEDWHCDGSRMDGGLSDGEASRGSSRGRSSRRDDPRRHTLAGNHLYVHPHHPSQISIDMEPYGPARVPMNTPEYATINKARDQKPTRILDPRMKKPPLPRYPPPSNNLLFDDDPGIMSEVETASTGFRRGGKQRSSLPVVRTPSKTLERPLGLVFLQYRNETKRALLPNEITAIDTVKALFVRSFPKQLTMQYMDSPMVKIYIHDSSKDMFYELEDDRAHLRDIRDRSVLRLFEATDIGGGAFPGAVGVGSVAMPAGAASCSGPSSWDQDQSYFSEPEIDSEYHHQHVHKSKVKAPAYYIGGQAPSTLPRGGSILRAFSPAAPPVPADRVKPHPASGHAEGYMSSPERGAARAPYEDPYYTQYLGPGGARQNLGSSIDEEASDGVMIDEAYQMYGVNAITTAPRPMPRPAYDARPQVDDMQRLRVEKMERQLANLTGLVQKALQVPSQPPAPAVAPRQEYQTYQARPPAQDAARFTSNERPPKLGRDKFQKSVSFEKSVSFSDDPPDMSSPKQHSPQHAERDRLKPAPPPKPAGLVGQQLALVPQKTYTINVTPDFFSQLRVLQKQSRDLRIETRNLRRSTLTHAIQMRQLMAETIVKIGALAASFCELDPDSQLTREEEIYRQDMLLLENDLYELEATVERLRGQAANRETRVNMADIERIAMVLSKSSKTVADWKLKFPILQETMKAKLAAEMEKVVRKEKMLEEEPERLELALRRCKKLTGTLVTLKRLACVQEQRLPLTDGRVSPVSSQSSTFTAGPSSEECASDSTCHNTQANKGTGGVGRGSAGRGADVRPENALDALLDELQTFAKPAERSGARGEGPLRRLHSYPSGSDTDASPPVRARGQHPPKPPVPERHPELLALAARRAPPPPPPRTTSRSPLASPTSPASPPRDPDPSLPHASDPPSDDDKASNRQTLLEQRHQELLKKQKALQEQYARLQMIQRSGPALPPNAQLDLKKTGSESNLLSKMNLNLAPATVTGSMTHLAGDERHAAAGADNAASQPEAVPTTNKVYETDIL